MYSSDSYSSDSGENDSNGSDSEGRNLEDKVYLPTFPGPESKKALTFDKSAYVYYHEIIASSSALSFDFIPNPNFTGAKDDAATSVLFVTGTQVDGKISIVYVTDILPLNHEEDDDECLEPTVKHIAFSQNGGVNRIRFNLGGPNLLASWSDQGAVNIWNIGNCVEKVLSGAKITQAELNGSNQKPPTAYFDTHKTSGFGLDWSKVRPGRLASGDDDGYIYVYSVERCDSFVQLRANNSSVEDIQWSPNEANILCSCGCDGFIRIWDCRANSKNGVRESKISDVDVNVISWSATDPLILSGDDDGSIKVWDLRQLSQTSKPVAFFNYHRSGITSLEWHPDDSTTFVSSGQDNQVTLWDISAEPENNVSSEIDIPPQLLFIHLGQEDIKEAHWNRQHPGLLTSVDLHGFNIFKTISVV